jgi:hypothetical protein
MHQPITLAKVRKAQTIKVPAGGWIILVDPDQSFDKHHNKRKSLSESPVSEDYETVACGRLDNKYADLKLKTADEQKAESQRLKDYDESLARSIKDAERRQSAIDSSETDKGKAAHEKRVLELNIKHDAIRNQGQK